MAHVDMSNVDMSDVDMLGIQCEYIYIFCLLIRLSVYVLFNPNSSENKCLLEVF